MISVSVADFTKTPGGRDRDDGEFSGAEFREEYLEPLFADKDNAEKIVIQLDGTLYGYPPSFIDEAFGGLARKFGTKRVLDRMEFVSNNKLLVMDIFDCIIGK